MADWVFMADAHLREWDFHGQTRIVRFLEREKRNLGTLVILGDLFEFWFGFEPFAFEGYRPVLDKLRELAGAGVRIRYVEGNHDFNLGSYVRERLKAEVCPEHCVVDLDGKRVYMAHGDLVNGDERFYRVFRRILRSPFTYWLIQRAGPRICKRAASLLGSVSGGKGSNKNPERIEALFRRFAVEKLREGFDVVILAHNHLPQACMFEVDGREAQYFNVGDWVNHFSYVRYRPGRGFAIEYCPG
ncbi:MAG: UDP-2,3-diacylglucosamine diphosphatase [Deltaproteobacteria bacterium]|nr:UDP-2,3-diacylglucosamine diphosphatase [Deltaproteobacteria bacterium]MBW2121122.1 UDP-2,3-diacylglucosamine diphosphatase [Deltaproteobacteria bacterium]